LFRLLLVPAVREQVIGCSNGTTVNMLKADGLAMPRFICPPRPLVEAYERVAGPIQARQEQNVAAAENLATLRDTLLPRLMSGKLRIPEVKEELPV
jgi:type I restriction enzyme S subunit